MRPVPTLFFVFLCAATADAQSGRAVYMSGPTALGQSARLDLTYPPSAIYNSYVFMASLPPMAGSTPLGVPGFTVLGQPSIDLATAVTMFVGQIRPNLPVTHTLSVPGDPALVGIALDVQAMDWSVPSRTIAFSDNELVMAVQARNWQPPVVLSSTATAGPPRLALRDQGDGIAVWVDGGGTPGLAASRFAPTTGWSSATVLAAAGGAVDLDVGIDAAGNAICVWTENRSVWASRETVGSGWSTPVLLETGGGDAGHPQLTVDAAGNAIAVWWQYDGAFNTGVVSVFAARYSVGQGWSSPAVIENDNQNHGEPPAIAGDAAGNATAVWRWSYVQNGVWFSTAMANRYTPGSGWGTAVAITNDTRIGGDGPPAVAVDGADAVVAWEAFVPGNSFGEMHATRWTGGAWGPTVRLDPTTASRSSEPQVLLTGGGDAVACWTELDGAGRILTSTMQSGAWSPASVAVAPPGTWARGARLRQDGGGRITMTYAHGTPGNMLVGCYSSHFLPGIGWLTPYRIDDNNHSGCYGASGLCIDAADNLVAVVREQWFGGSYKIVATTFR